MSDHIRSERLQDFVDDLLCREERAEVERHIVACDECARQVGALRDLVAELGTLPLALAPERDLLPQINEQIDAGATADAEWRIMHAERPPASRRARALLAAGVVLVAASAAWWGLRNDAAPTSAVPPGTAALQQVEQEYQATATELESLFDASSAALRPETRRIVAENLAVIDQALAEARAALRDDPGNPVLERILLANHEKKLDLLRGAARAGT